jgi:hypothetical protein
MSKTKDTIKQIAGDVKEIKIHQAVIRADQANIKTDLEHHIKRTDLLEAKMSSVTHKAIMGLAFLGGLFGAIKHLLALFS